MCFVFFSSRRRHTRYWRDWSSDVCSSDLGQIYVPWVNWLLLVSVLTLVFAFRSSAALAYAFGMAVTGTITITTLLFFYVAHRSEERRVGKEWRSRWSAYY